MEPTLRTVNESRNSRTVGKSGFSVFRYFWQTAVLTTGYPFAFRLRVLSSYMS